jgi:predicted transcriptional regulator
MADVCDYVYVSGLRFKSGTPFIEIQSSFLDSVSKEPSKEPSKLVRLAVVRDGKGASRLDRWASKPSRFGVVGEINLRDLSKVLDNSGMSDVDALVSLSLDDSSDAGLISLVLDPTAAMGRRGRLLDSDIIDDALLSLPDPQCQALVKDQLRNMPYGVENSKAASLRLQVLLRHATPESIAEVVKESTDFVKHIDRETVALMPPDILASLQTTLLPLSRTSPSHYDSHHSLDARRHELSIMAAADAGQIPWSFTKKVPNETVPFIDDNFIVAAAIKTSAHPTPLQSATFKYTAYVPLVKSKDALELLITSDYDVVCRDSSNYRSSITDRDGNPTEEFTNLTRVLESRLSDDVSRLEAMAARFPDSMLEAAVAKVLDKKPVAAPTTQLSKTLRQSIFSQIRMGAE